MKRYWILAGLLFAQMALQTSNGQWGSDFWEHAAVVRELMTHPLAPQHPQLLLPAPHVEYSPYTLAVALAGRALALTPIAALEIAGLLNLILFLVALRWFVVVLLGDEAAAFYTLLFTLFLWGRWPWQYSGFFHFAALGSGLAYPSMFAAGALFLCWGAALRYLRGGERRWLVAAFVLAPLVLIAHPLTAIALLVGLAAFAWSSLQRANAGRALALGAAAAAGCALALAWPYYPLWDLLAAQSALYYREHTEMYVDVLRQIWPALAGVPLLLLRARADWRDALAWMALGLGAVYAVGGLAGRESYGRTLPYLVLALHLAIADWAARFERMPGPLRLRGVAVSRRVLALLGVLALVAYGAVAFRGTLARAIPGQADTYSRYAFLGQYTGQYDVVISDILTSHVVPVFGGKIVSSPNPLPWVRDQRERSDDLRRFFAADASRAEREEVIAKYRASYVLIDRERFAAQPALIADISALGSEVYRDGTFTLIRVMSPQGWEAFGMRGAGDVPRAVCHVRVTPGGGGRTCRVAIRAGNPDEGRGGACPRPSGCGPPMGPQPQAQRTALRLGRFARSPLLLPPAAGRATRSRPRRASAPGGGAGRPYAARRPRRMTGPSRSTSQPRLSSSHGTMRSTRGM